MISLRMYKKMPISPYAYQCFALWSIAVFGFCTFFGEVFNIVWLLQAALFGLGMGYQFYCKFFRLLFGKMREYESLQILMAAIFGLVVIENLLYPPQSLDTQIIFAPKILYGMEGITVCFFIITLDYALFSLRKIIRQHLAVKLSSFSITILASIICTLIPFLGYQGGLVPIYVPFSVQALFVILLMILLLKYPDLNFLALIDPHILGVVHKSGLTLYSYQFQKIGQEQLFAGAMTAINSIFKETIAQEGIEQIHFRGKIIYCRYHPQFFVVYIDNTYMPFISQAIKEFTDLVAKKYLNLIDPWTGIVDDKFNAIENDMRKVFYFLPQLIK